MKTIEERRKHKNWCSKHQRVHKSDTYQYSSCRFPNDKSKRLIKPSEYEDLRFL